MKILVGLGNPGNRYLWTRHNLGFMLIDSLCDPSLFKKKHKSLVQKSPLGGEPVLLVKPQTYMNLSGTAVKELVAFYKIPLKNLLVIHDDKDLLFANMKLQKSRGHGGHNGIKSIHESLNSKDYCRLKMGVAPNPALSLPKGETRPVSDISLARQREQAKLLKESIRETKNISANINMPSTADFVLSAFNKQEQAQLPEFLRQARRALELWIKEGLEKAGSLFNN